VVKKSVASGLRRFFRHKLRRGQLFDPRKRGKLRRFSDSAAHLNKRTIDNAPTEPNLLS
jgi:hypothetical protein